MQDIQMVNIKKESVIITMDYVHNQMDYFDPVSQSTVPEDIPEFRNKMYLLGPGACIGGQRTGRTS